MTSAVQVLCTTSTLAMGVNLPAHLVVLKGTRRWTAEAGEPAGYQEYDRSTCLQMIGRAGRPQFDTEGIAVIMTQRQVLPAACTLQCWRCCQNTTVCQVWLQSPLLAIDGGHKVKSEADMKLSRQHLYTTAAG